MDRTTQKSLVWNCFVVKNKIQAMQSTGIRKISPPAVGVLDLVFIWVGGPSSLINCLIPVDFKKFIKGVPINKEIPVDISKRLKYFIYTSLPRSDVTSCSVKNPKIGEISIPLIGGIILRNGSRKGTYNLSKKL